MRKHFPWLGGGLILVGLALLLDRIGVVKMGWEVGAGVLLALYGGFTLVRAFIAGRKHGIFWGLILLVVAGCSVLGELGVLSIPLNIQFPLVLMLIGTGFLLIYLKHLREWVYLIPAGFFLLVGTGIWMSESGWLETWQVRAAISMYWPIALMLLGVGVIFSRRTA